MDFAATGSYACEIALETPLYSKISRPHDITVMGQFILGLALLEVEDAEGAYAAFCKAAKGVSSEPFLRQLVAAAGSPATQHQALVLYYMKLRQGQSYCTDNECLEDLPGLPAPQSAGNSFLVMFLMMAFAVAMYMMRPRRNQLMDAAKPERNSNESGRDARHRSADGERRGRRNSIDK